MDTHRFCVAIYGLGSTFSEYIYTCIDLTWEKLVDYGPQFPQLYIIYNLYYKINFSIGNFVLKIKKRKKYFWPKKVVFIQNLWTKTLFCSKTFSYKSILRILKKRSGQKVRAPQNPKKRRFPWFWGALTFSPERFFNILRILL